MFVVFGIAVVLVNYAKIGLPLVLELYNFTNYVLYNPSTIYANCKLKKLL